MPSSSFWGVVRGIFVFLGCVALAHGGAVSAQVRFHSASDEAATALISTELEKARLAHLAALDAHRAYLVDALRREQKLLVQRELAERDAFITIILSAKARGIDPIATLAEQVDSEWSEIVGPQPQSVGAAEFVNIANQLYPLEIERAGLIRNRAATISIFEGKGGKGSYCALNGSGTIAFTQHGDTDEANAITETCQDLADIEKRIQALYSKAGPASALLGNPAGTKAGMIGQALSEVREIATLIEAQNVLVTTVAAQMKSLDAYYKCEANRGSVAQKVSADAQAIQSALDMLASGDAVKVFEAATFNDIWDKLTTSNVNVDRDCTKLEPPEGPSLKSKRMSTDEVLAAIGALDQYFAKGAVLALVRDAALDIQGSSLDEALNGLAAASTDTDAADSKIARRVMAALKIFGGLEQYGWASAGKMPDTAGVLVALADVRMRQATAKIEADRLAELDRLSKLRLIALRQRGIQLASARSELETKATAEVKLSNSLRRYSESVNRGAIPATVLANSMVKGRTLPWIDRERAVVEAAYAVLAPAATQLQAYGKGGITSDTLAQFLQAAGLGGIAVK